MPSNTFFLWYVEASVEFSYPQAVGCLIIIGMVHPGRFDLLHCPRIPIELPETPARASRPVHTRRPAAVETCAQTDYVLRQIPVLFRRRVPGGG
ncbi:MAG: hypothetical protein GY792_03540 [Gammaproteobacteria bacterium]|nr:hypothetical protein [Gammaproteobacteria bacterium]